MRGLWQVMSLAVNLLPFPSCRTGLFNRTNASVWRCVSAPPLSVVPKIVPMVTLPPPPPPFRLLVITLGLFSKDHVHQSMMEGGGGFSALRLAGLSPSEVALLSTACTTDRCLSSAHGHYSNPYTCPVLLPVWQYTLYVCVCVCVCSLCRLLFMCQHLMKLSVTYLQGVWHSSVMSRTPLFLLTPALPLSPWAIRDSPTLSSLVFVSPTKATLGHNTVVVRPLKTVAMPTEEQACDLQQNGCLSADLCLPEKGECNGELSPGSRGVGCAGPTPCQSRDSPMSSDCPGGGCQLPCQLVGIPSLLYVSAWQVGGVGRLSVLSWQCTYCVT